MALKGFFLLVVSTRDNSRYANGKFNLALTSLPPRKARPRSGAEPVQRRYSWLRGQRSPMDETWRGGEERVILPSYGL